jgi:hypothetical protein
MKTKSGPFSKRPLLVDFKKIIACFRKQSGQNLTAPLCETAPGPEKRHTHNIFRCSRQGVCSGNPSASSCGRYFRIGWRADKPGVAAGVAADHIAHRNRHHTDHHRSLADKRGGAGGVEADRNRRHIRPGQNSQGHQDYNSNICWRHGKFQQERQRQWQQAIRRSKSVSCASPVKRKTISNRQLRRALDTIRQRLWQKRFIFNIFCF